MRHGSRHGETIETSLKPPRSSPRSTGRETRALPFTPWSFTPAHCLQPGFEEPTAVEYLKTLAISRLYLDNIQNVQSNLETQGLKVLQVGLRFGGKRRLQRPTGSRPAATEEQVRQIIRETQASGLVQREFPHHHSLNQGLVARNCHPERSLAQSYRELQSRRTCGAIVPPADPAQTNRILSRRID